MIKVKKVDEKELVATLKNVGATSREKETAFNNLYARYREGIYYYLLKKVRHVELTEDLVMITFQKVYEKIDLYKLDSGAVSTWIYSIARNSMIDHLRAEKIETISIDTQTSLFADGSIQGFQLASDYESSLDVVHEKEEKFKKLKQAIISLEDDEVRKIMYYRYVKGMSVNKIEVKLGLENSSTTRVKIHRGKKLISDMLTRL